MMDTVLMNIVTPAVAAGLTWLVTKRKNKAEVKSSELDNYDKNLRIYQNMIDDLKLRTDQLLNSNHNLVESLRKQLDTNRELLLEQERLRVLLSDRAEKSETQESVLRERKKNIS